MARHPFPIVLLLLSSSASAQHEYTITDLGCSDCGPNFVGASYAVNNSGEVVGMARHADGQAYPFYWYDGKTIELPSGVGAMNWANGINDAGLVGGGVAMGPAWADQVPVVWDPPQPAGSYTTLPVPNDSNRGVVWRVNELGHAVGRCWFGAFVVNWPCLWVPEEQGWDVTTLPYLPGGNSGSCNGIGSSGAMIVGFGWSNDLRRPVVWEQGAAAGAWEVADLGTLGGPEGMSTDVIDEDEISGVSETAGGHWHATLWRRIDGTWTADEDLGVLPGHLTSASWSSNSLGQVVGWSFAADSNNPIDYAGPANAFLWEAGVMHDLNDMVVEADGWHVRQAWDISDTGLIAGLAEAPNGELHNVLLEPVCAADVTGDGTVDVADLVDVILAWGSNDDAADVNDDGIVDVLDLVTVIVNWGSCS